MLCWILGILAPEKPLKHSHSKSQLSAPAWKAERECGVGWKSTERGCKRGKVKKERKENIPRWRCMNQGNQGEGRKIWELKGEGKGGKSAGRAQEQGRQ